MQQKHDRPNPSGRLAGLRVYFHGLLYSHRYSILKLISVKVDKPLNTAAQSVHEKTRDAACAEPGCGKSFSTKWSLAAHHRAHRRGGEYRQGGVGTTGWGQENKKKIYPQI